MFYALPWLTWHCIVGRVDDVILFSGIPYVSQATDPDAFKNNNACHPGTVSPEFSVLVFNNGSFE